MPLVVVQYKSGRITEQMLENLAKAMPDIVANALNIPSDIGVWVRESGKYDVNTKDLEIIIWANSYPERLRDLERRKDVIVQAVRKFLADYDRNLSGFVWVLLQPAAFGEL